MNQHHFSYSHCLSALMKETKKSFGMVIHATKHGWSITAKKTFHDFYVKREDLSVTAENSLCFKEMIIILTTL